MPYGWVLPYTVVSNLLPHSMIERTCLLFFRVETLSRPRWEDYEITYSSTENQWAFLGIGMTLADVDPVADKSPYLAFEELDPQWLKAVGTKSHFP
jgi:hypothetical protein